MSFLILFLKIVEYIINCFFVFVKVIPGSTWVVGPYE